MPGALPTRSSRRPRISRRALAPAGLGALLAAGLAATLAGNAASAPPGPSGPVDLNVAPVALRTFGSCAALLDHYRSTGLDHVGPYGFGGHPGMEFGMPGVATPSAAAPDSVGGANATKRSAADGTRSSSGTNVQVAGVDEADLAKRAGDLLLTLHQNADGRSSLIILRTEAGKATRVGGLKLPGSPSSMLVDGDTVLVLGTDQTGLETTEDDESGGSGSSSRRLAPDSPVWAPVNTRVDQVDIADPSRPRLVRSLVMDGVQAGARLVDGVARIAVTSSPHLRFSHPVQSPPEIAPNRGAGGTPTRTSPEQAATQRNQRIVKESSIEDWLPRYRLTEAGGTSSSGSLVGCRDVAAPARPAGVSTLTLVGFDLRDGGLTSRHSASVVADGSTMYATADRTYVSTPVTPTAPGGSAQRNIYLPPTSTAIHAFDTTGRGTSSYLASGEVKGTLLNQFSMDEHDGVLRVATTEEPIGRPIPMEAPVDDTAVSPPSPPTSQNRVTVLRRSGERLVKVGDVSGLGKGERIYSVRFAGPIGYVVTFRQTDPLYTLDLSDPARPTVAGELKIRGYSAYLQPAGDGLLLGVGQDATTEGRVTGLQMSLFDVSDPAAPQRISQVKLPNAYSDAEYDHHAFTLADGLALVPFRRTFAEADRPGFLGGLAAVRLSDRDLEGPSLLTMRAAGDSQPDPNSPFGWDGDTPQRTFVDRGVIWSVSWTGVSAHDAETLRHKSFTPLS